ncbi:MAG TPA: YqgE/AlgH family protein [Gammaproteobacteria bacterium]|nr:YqgE/AlgH family protein [Xanthomonadales bacterium]MCB1593503.1 YqgE/AlgH family protein [Xanthomonadales bacterium]HOP21715.1 YqgE/AlgH family protein [Gammaproteobacteria bacterium]HPI95277.1 YqgE/AlgH family protein [Gammaproteobacteria bacterium]HPQ86666.1 YqgE/AlgH family protein [Gammaproteobacteria bacterium]
MDFNQQMLIALPDMQDERFKQAVIVICEDNINGTLGLVINHPLNLNTQQIFSELGLNEPNSNHLTSEGGPVNVNNGFILHNSNDKFKSSLSITDQLTMTTSNDLLEEIANNNFHHKWQFVLGCSAWDKGQLLSEIQQNAWLTCPINLPLIFDTPHEQQWEKALSLIGIKDFTHLTSGIGHA